MAGDGVGGADFFLDTVPSLMLTHLVLDVFYRWRLFRCKNFFQGEQGSLSQRLARNHVGEGQLGFDPAPSEPEHVWFRKAERDHRRLAHEGVRFLKHSVERRGRLTGDVAQRLQLLCGLVRDFARWAHVGEPYCARAYERWTFGAGAEE